MAGYIFEHDGKQFTPDGQIHVPSTADYNRALEQAELAQWKTQPDHWIGYLKVASRTTVVVNTWLGTTLGLGIITGRSRGFGSELIHVRIEATNGAYYYGKGSGDGMSIRLHKSRAKGKR